MKRYLLILSMIVCNAYGQIPNNKTLEGNSENNPFKFSITYDSVTLQINAQDRPLFRRYLKGVIVDSFVMQYSSDSDTIPTTDDTAKLFIYKGEKYGGANLMIRDTITDATNIKIDSFYVSEGSSWGEVYFSHIDSVRCDRIEIKKGIMDSIPTDVGETTIGIITSKKQFDTVRCYALIKNTTTKKTIAAQIFLVRKLFKYTEPGEKPKYYYEDIEYLGQDKKPLPQNLTVMQSTELK